MKKFQKIFVGLVIFTIFLLPASVSAGIVPCDGSVADPCDFNAFMELINEVIKFALFKLALPIAAIMFAYAGIKLVLSGGDTEARGTAKNIFINTAIGIIIAAAAYLIVSLILSTLSPGNWTWIGFS